MKNDRDNPTPDREVDPLDELLRSARWPDDASDPLDELLCMARWPEAAADSLPDWRQQMARWQSRRAVDRVGAKPLVKPVRTFRREKWRKAWAIAASAAVAALFMVMSVWIMRPAGDPSSAGAPTTVARNLAADAPVSADARETLPENVAFQNTIAAGGSLVPLEMPHGDPYQRMLRARRQASAASEGDDAIDRIVAQRTAEPDGDLQEFVQPLLAERAECERRLLERFHTFADEQASAAIELLGCVGGEASLPLVRQLSFRPATHAPAVRALLKIADTRMLARLAFNESDPELREEITAALRARGDKRTLMFVLATQGEYSCLDSGSDLWRPAE